jgi:P27 family predicted phage terminase small subunit
MTGSRGPLPKPPALRALEGNAGKRALDLSAGVNPRVEVPDAPAYIRKSKEAYKEWKRITPILEELGLISSLDRTALGLYCQAVGRLHELEMAFCAQVTKLEGNEVTYVEAVARASQSATPSGYVQQSVMVQLIKSHREQVNRYLMHFGLSPAARARVQASNYVDPTLDLPGFESSKPSGFQKFSVVQAGR